MSKDSASELIRARDVAGFDRWSLPSFDPFVPEPEPLAEPEVVEAPEPAYIEEVPVEAVAPLTLEEVEAIRQDAYNEGFSTGEKDGFHSGQLKARQEAEVALAAKLKQLESIMQHLLEPIAGQDTRLEEAVVVLVRHMAEQVIRRELSEDSTQLRKVLQEALKLLPVGANNIRIYVNPQDFDLIKELRARHEEQWRILEDESLLPGGCRIETEFSHIDASVETRLAHAVEQLFAQRREQLSNPPSADIHLEIDLDAS